MTDSARSPDFQRAFVAMSYYWGARGAALGQGLEGLGVHTATLDLINDLAHSDRGERARALGTELGRIAAALEARGLAR